MHNMQNYIIYERSEKCVKFEWNLLSGIRSKLQTIATTAQPPKWKENVRNFHKY
jgi:L-rhamnose mutarotase